MIFNPTDIENLKQGEVEPFARMMVKFYESTGQPSKARLLQSGINQYNSIKNIPVKNQDSPPLPSPFFSNRNL